MSMPSSANTRVLQSSSQTSSNIQRALYSGAANLITTAICRAIADVAGIPNCRCIAPEADNSNLPRASPKKRRVSRHSTTKPQKTCSFAINCTSIQQCVKKSGNIHPPFSNPNPKKIPPASEGVQNVVHPSPIWVCTHFIQSGPHQTWTKLISE
jgi:hypothetical protein